MYVPYHLASASAGETLDLIALRTAFFTGVGFFAFFATTGFFFTTGFFTTGFFLPSSANGFVGRLGSDGPSAFFAAGFAAGFFAAGFFAAGFAVVFLTTVFLAGAFFGAGVARLDRAAFTCIVERVRV